MKESYLELLELVLVSVGIVTMFYLWYATNKVNSYFEEQKKKREKAASTASRLKAIEEDMGGISKELSKWMSMPMVPLPPTSADDGATFKIKTQKIYGPQDYSSVLGEIGADLRIIIGDTFFRLPFDPEVPISIKEQLILDLHKCKGDIKVAGILERWGTRPFYSIRYIEIAGEVVFQTGQLPIASASCYTRSRDWIVIDRGKYYKGTIAGALSALREAWRKEAKKDEGIYKRRR